MAVTDRLAAALDERASGARPTPDALDRIRTRALHHRRMTRLRVVGAVAAVAAVALAVPALRSPGTTGLEPPAATTAPTTLPTTMPTVSSSPTSATAPAPVARDEIVVVTASRRLAVVSTKTGKVTRTVTAFDRMPVSVDLAPDGRSALLVLPPETEQGCGSVVEVDLVSRAQRTLISGFQARYSPNGQSIAVDTCPGNAVRILRAGQPARTIPYGAPEDYGIGPLQWGDDEHLYVQEIGDDSNPLYRLDLTDQTVQEAEKVVVTYFITMNVPVPWRDTLLHTAASEFDEAPYEVLAAESYRMNEYLEKAKTLFTVPYGIDDLVVGPRDEVLVSAGGSFWLWQGSGEAVEVGKAYPLFAW